MLGTFQETIKDQVTGTIPTQGEGGDRGPPELPTAGSGKTPAQQCPKSYQVVKVVQSLQGRKRFNNKKERQSASLLK